MSIKAGDLIQSGSRYGEVVGIEDGVLEVYFLKRETTNVNHSKYWIWKYEEEWETLPQDDVTRHIPMQKSKVIECFLELGFRPLTEETFQKFSDKIPDHVSLPVGLDTNEEDSSYVYDDMFVKDEDSEPFTYADPSIPYVKETHELVHQYNQWVPKDKKQEKIKEFVEDWSKKYKLRDDEHHFTSGTSVNYDRPPL